MHELIYKICKAWKQCLVHGEFGMQISLILHSQLACLFVFLEHRIRIDWTCISAYCSFPEQICNNSIINFFISYIHKNCQISRLSFIYIHSIFLWCLRWVFSSSTHLGVIQNNTFMSEDYISVIIKMPLVRTIIIIIRHKIKVNWIRIVS